MTNLTANSFSESKIKNLIILSFNQNKTRNLKGFLRNNKILKNRNLLYFKRQRIKSQTKFQQNNFSKQIILCKTNFIRKTQDDQWKQIKRKWQPEIEVKIMNQSTHRGRKQQTLRDESSTAWKRAFTSRAKNKSRRLCEKCPCLEFF